MNWKELFDTLIELDKIDEAIRTVENDQDVKVSTPQQGSLELRLLNAGETEGTVYDFRSDKMFAVAYEGDVVSVGKPFLLDSLKSQQLKRDLNRTRNDVTFFDFQFLLYMTCAADVSSGFTWFRKSVNDIVDSLKHGPVNLNGFEILSEEALNDYLKRSIHGFEPLFKSVDDIRTYA